MHIGEKIREHRKSIGLEAQWKGPKKMGAVIEDN